MERRRQTALLVREREHSALLDHRVQRWMAVGIVLGFSILMLMLALLLFWLSRPGTGNDRWLIGLMTAALVMLMRPTAVAIPRIVTSLRSP